METTRASGFELELISFGLCPYVQKAVVALKKKGAAFTTTYIDLDRPPEWFDAISPLGQVPVLKVNGEHAIFESSVICELLDEIVEPRFHLADPIARAKERSWIEYASSLIADQGAMLWEENLTVALALKQELFESVERLESVLGSGPYFRGPEFSLVDASFAPFFMRLAIIPGMFEPPHFKQMPKVRAWAETLLALPEVRESVPENFRADYLARFRAMKSAMLLNT